jgi:hypothetical protein
MYRFLGMFRHSAIFPLDFLDRALERGLCPKNATAETIVPREGIFCERTYHVIALE